MSSVRVGFSLSTERTFVERCAPVLAAADYLEVVPEALVDPRDQGGFRENGGYRRTRELQQRLGVPLVAHGTGLSVCGAHALDRPRLARWLERAAALADRLRFEWYTDHSGITAPAGLNLALPMGVPPTLAARDAARARLDALGAAVGVPVGVENSVVYAPLADPQDEAPFLRDVLEGRHAMLLDVHNLWVHEVNLGLDVDRWLAEAPLDRVIEVHVAGGRPADPAWTEGRERRLDGHDAAVPEPVWALLDRVLARTPALRGVTLERLEGSVEPEDTDLLVGELARVRDAVGRRTLAPSPPAPPIPAWDPGGDAELVLADAWTARDPAAALHRLADDAPPWLGAAIRRCLATPDGVGLTRRILLRLRFERLVQGSASAAGWFEADPASFARAFADYAAAVPPTAFLPLDEAVLWERYGETRC